MKDKGLSSAVLKNIAIITMLIDHLTHVLYRPFLVPLLGRNLAMLLYYPLRAVGRMAFLLFAFQVGQAIIYTKSKKRYLLGLGLFALISELPFDLALFGKLVDINHQNVFFTLLLGALACIFVEKYGDKKWKVIFVSILCISLAEFAHTDYGGAGVLLIILLYQFRNNYYAMQCIAFPAFILLLMVTNGAWAIFTKPGDDILMKFMGEAMNASLELFGIVSLFLVRGYNGKKGKMIGKWFYYYFYPGHLLVLYALVKIIKAFLIK